MSMKPSNVLSLSTYYADLAEGFAKITRED